MISPCPPYYSSALSCLLLSDIEKLGCGCHTRAPKPISVSCVCRGAEARKSVCFEESFCKLNVTPLKLSTDSKCLFISILFSSSAHEYQPTLFTSKMWITASSRPLGIYLMHSILCRIFSAYLCGNVVTFHRTPTFRTFSWGILLLERWLKNL